MSSAVYSIPGFTEAVSDRPKILIIAGSHGFPQTQARLSRPAEIASALRQSGAAVDVVLLEEKRLQPTEEDALDRLREQVDQFELIHHPVLGSFAFQAVRRLRAAFSCVDRLGGGLHCPQALTRLLRSKYAARQYRAVLVCGVHLAKTLTAFPRHTEKFVDLQCLGADAHRSHERLGRGDALSAYSDAKAELSLLSLADVVMVNSVADTVRLRELGITKDLVLAPPTGLLVTESRRLGRPDGFDSPYLEPPRPPRILCVGSETTANLDAVRWFRRQVYPHIVLAAPTCRLRLVGEVARHIEPGPGVDRIGWVDCLEEEYRDATVVALPLRMGSGVRRRAVEALTRGKALATSTIGAYGTGLEPQRDAIVTDDPRCLATEIGRTLVSDTVRMAYEDRALSVARESFGLERALGTLAERLYLVSRQKQPVAVARSEAMA